MIANNALREIAGLIANLELTLQETYDAHGEGFAEAREEFGRLKSFVAKAMKGEEL